MAILTDEYVDSEFTHMEVFQITTCIIIFGGWVSSESPSKLEGPRISHNISYNYVLFVKQSS